MAYPTSGTTPFRDFAGSFYGFKEEVKQAKDGLAEAERQRDAARESEQAAKAAAANSERENAELKARIDGLKAEQTVKVAAVMALAEERDAALKAEIGKTAALKAQIEKAEAGFKLVLKSAQEKEIELNKRIFDLSSLKDNAEIKLQIYEQRERDREITAYRGTYEIAISFWKGQIDSQNACKNVGLIFGWSGIGLAVAYLCKKDEASARRTAQQLERALSSFNEKVKSKSPVLTPHIAFRLANEDHSCEHLFT